MRRTREETKRLSYRRRFIYNGISDFRAKKGGKAQEGLLESGRRGGQSEENLGLAARISVSREKIWIHVETPRSRKIQSIGLKK